MPTSTEAAPLRRFSQRHGEAILELFGQHRDPGAVAQQLRLPERSVRRFLASTGQLHRALPAGTEELRARKWSRDDLVEVLRRAAQDCGDPLTLKSFERWAAERESAPSQRTLFVHFGSWRNACAAAGLNPGESSRSYTSAVTAQECWDAVTAYVSECETEGIKPTMTGYERLSADRGWPCRNSITLRIGPWRTVVRSVFDRAS